VDNGNVGVVGIKQLREKTIRCVLIKCVLRAKTMKCAEEKVKAKLKALLMSEKFPDRMEDFKECIVTPVSMDLMNQGRGNLKDIKTSPNIWQVRDFRTAAL
jgi:hypothetical protein